MGYRRSAKRKGNKYTVRLLKSRNSLLKATRKRKWNQLHRMWVQYTPEIHLLNYWYYRGFTNSFRDFVLDNIEPRNMEKQLTQK